LLATGRLAVLTLRQIEIIRAIMVTGTIAGAAKLLNVSAPGVSRLMKFTEGSLGVPLFNRRHGRYVPTPEARSVFDLLDGIHRKVEDLQTAIDRLASGEGRELSVASVPSIANVMIPRAVERLKRRFPDIGMEIGIVMTEHAVDHLLLGRAEVVAVTSRFDHSIIDFAPLAAGRLLCLVPRQSGLAGRRAVTPAEIATHPLVGFDPDDPHGRLITEIFRREGLACRMSVRTRFAATVGSLVAAGLGIAVTDEFTVAGGMADGVECLEIDADTRFGTYAAYRNDTALSVYAEAFIDLLREEMGAPRACAPAPFRRGWEAGGN
jgi:DNA-binding transcriptional LysR family regulator